MKRPTTKTRKTSHTPLPPILFFRYPDFVVPLPEALPVCRATLRLCLAAAAKTPEALSGSIPSRGR